ncbi:MAG TPA: acetolactate synthase, partial [Candidatus Lokiarchaeia archaeon]
ITVAENEDYGLLLLLADKPNELYELLDKEDYPVSITEVIAVKMSSSKSGGGTKGLKEIAEITGKNNINIEFLYSTLIKDESLIILKVDNNDKAREVLEKEGFLLEERDSI